MVRIKKQNRQKGDHAGEDMLRAMLLHRNGKSLRKAAQECGVRYPTLFRYVKKYENMDDASLSNQRFTPNYEVNKTFTIEHETALKEYIQECALKFYGLCSKDVRRIAYQMAKINNIKCHDSWENDKMAGIEWLRSFKSRHPDLTL